MLISEENKFAFIHIPKNAGTTVRMLLDKYRSNHSGDIFHHIGISDATLPEDFYTFAFVRNPWDRMVSIYEFTKKRIEQYPHRYKDFKGYDQFNWDFEKWLMEGAMYSDNFGVDTLPPIQRLSQSYYIADKKGNIIIDKVGKVETFDKDLEDIASYLCLKISSDRFFNNTETKPYQKYYSKKGKSFIEKYFKWDIETFEYEF